MNSTQTSISSLAHLAVPIMSNPPPEQQWTFSFPTAASMFSDAGSSSSSSAPPPLREETMSYARKLIQALRSPEARDRALSQLAKLQSKVVREQLAPLLWHSVGTVTVLLQEITSVYRLHNITDKQSTRACNALALFQGMAAHPEIKHSLLRANIPMYIYPFLESTRNEKPHEFLRLTSLGVIGALVKVDDPVTTRFLLESQIFPCCLRCMEFGDHLLSKTVATFIVYKLILSDEGLRYCCALADRFFAVSHQLGKMVEHLANNNELMLSGDTPKRLLKHIIWCYQRLSESPRACHGLRTWLPPRLRDSAFISIIQDDVTAMHGLQKLFNNLATRNRSPPPSVEHLLARLVRH